MEKIHIILLVCVFCNISFANNVFIPFEKFDGKFNIGLSEKDEIIFKQIKKDLANKNFSGAFIKTSKIENTINKELIQTVITAEGFKEINVLSYKNFINLILFNTSHNYLPFFDKFHSKIEKYYINNSNVKYEDVRHYFTKFKPKNVATYIKLLKQEDDFIFENYTGEELEDRKNKLNKKIINTWFNENFSNEANLLFYNKYKFVIKEENLIKKMELLSFNSDKTKLKNLLGVLKDSDYKALFDVIIKLDSNPKHMNWLLRDVPKKLRENEALAYAKAKYYRKNKKDKEVLKILYSMKDTVSKYPTKWWLYRHIYVRNLIRDKEYKRAYYIVANHGKLSRSDTYDAEWLSGWIALRFLNKPQIALEHFNYIFNNSSYPISASKATYWLGRTYQKLNNKKQMMYWYKKSAEFPLSFYGQMALSTLSSLKEGKDYNINIPKTPKFSNATAAENNKTIRFAHFYYKYLGENERAYDLFKKAINDANSEDEIIYVINLVSTFDDYNLLINLAKVANYRRVYFVDYLFPIIKLVSLKNINISFIHGIIKQESNFKFNAMSSVGATGFMQIMPDTAKHLCKDLKISYNQYKLKHDIQYNLRLGSYYIDKLLKTFNGSKVLAIASYNAGQGNVRKWINAYGDPRAYDNIDDIIDWIECIPFGETRNYTMRVLENMIVYDTILQDYYPNSKK